MPNCSAGKWTEKTVCVCACANVFVCVWCVMSVCIFLEPMLICTLCVSFCSVVDNLLYLYAHYACYACSAL